MTGIRTLQSQNASIASVEDAWTKTLLMHEIESALFAASNSPKAMSDPYISLATSSWYFFAFLSLKMATKAVVKMSEMDSDMLDFAVSQASYAQENMPGEKDVAHYLKHQFEEKYKPSWHCLVGRSFSSYVTHEKACCCYFYIGQMGVMLWKTPE